MQDNAEDNAEQSIYEPPMLEVLGDVHDLTEGLVRGRNPDGLFPHLTIS